MMGKDLGIIGSGLPACLPACLPPLPACLPPSPPFLISELQMTSPINRNPLHCQDTCPNTATHHCTHYHIRADTLLSHPERNWHSCNLSCPRIWATASHGLCLCTYMHMYMYMYCTCICMCIQTHSHITIFCGPTHPSHPMTFSTTSASRHGPLKLWLLSNFQQSTCTCT